MISSDDSYFNKSNYMHFFDDMAYHDLFGQEKMSIKTTYISASVLFSNIWKYISQIPIMYYMVIKVTVVSQGIQIL